VSEKQAIQDAVINANIYVHAFLANAGEYNKSPHYRPENQDKVRNILLRLTDFDKKRGRVVDFGCGTGFMINLMHDLFEEIHGVDITKDMMAQIDMTPGNIFLHEGLAENTQFPSEYFDFATAYSFMDHLLDYRAFLKEVYRVIKEGGVFYSDLNPNRDFVLAVSKIENLSNPLIPVKALVQKEIQGALHNGNYYKNQYGMNPELLEAAEPIKTHDKGFSALEVLETARELGFSDCRVEYEWFIGQANVMHQQSKADSDRVEQYLNSVLPMSSSLFKYLRFVFVK
jgi:ubiquinone/menaquinone biosynthesis C-methylase UbiE